MNLPIDLLNDTPWQIKLGALIIWQVVEYWLGKTDKTKAGSIPEFIFNLFKKGS